MASIPQDISIQVKNNLNRKTNFSLLGGTQDPSNGQANAKTLYEWDLSSETFTNTTVVEITASTVDNPTPVVYTAFNQDGTIDSLETVVRLLNTLNLGVFNLDGNIIFILDDINVFGNISIKISADFDIDIFVESAYNYYDSLGVTSLANFSGKYKDLIQFAVDNIPNFVEFITTQTWSLAYPCEAEFIRLTRSQSGTIYLVQEDAGGVLSLITATGTDEINTDPVNITRGLLFVFDINLYKGMTVFQLGANTGGESYVYKFVFTGFVSFISNDLNTFGWLLIAPSYIPPNTGGTQDTFFFLPLTGTSAVYGNSFPSSIEIADGQRLSFNSIGGNTNPFEIADNLDFGRYNGFFRLILQQFNSQSGNFDIDYSSVVLDNTEFENAIFSILFDDSQQETVSVDSAFNTKFSKATKLGGNMDTFTLAVYDTSVNTNQAQITLADTTTPVVINAETINFRRTFLTTIPEYGQLGGYTTDSNYNLTLIFSNQLDATQTTNISMLYFVTLFTKLGKQTFIYDDVITTGTRIMTFTTNSFILSGTGLASYNAILNRGFTFNLPVGAIQSEYISFGINPNHGGVGGTLIQFTNAISDPAFSVKYSEEGQVDVEQASIYTGTSSNVSIPNPSQPLNLILTSNPAVSFNNFSITVSGGGSTDAMLNSVLIGNGVQTVGGIDDQEIYGFTLVNNPSTNPLGLFARDFSGCGNWANLKIINYSVDREAPYPAYGSSALFNLPVSYLTATRSFELRNSEIFTSVSKDANSSGNVFPMLDLIGQADILIPEGTTLQDTVFNYSPNSSLPSTLNVVFLVSSNQFSGFNVAPLLGQSVVDGCTFRSGGGSTPDVDRMKFITETDGTDQQIQQISVRNMSIGILEVLNNSASTPVLTILEVQDVTDLTQILASNFNIDFVDFDNLPSTLTNIDLSENAMPSTVLDSLLIDVDTIGNSNGTLDYSAQSTGASPDIATSGTAYNNLISRGWTIVGNAPS